MTNLKTHYLNSVVPKLQKEFSYSNVHQIPKLEKIQLSAGLGLNAQNRVFLQKAIEEFRLITGQHPILTSARKSIAGFKIREGMPLGLTVTLRSEKMYSFLEKLICLVFPRIRDFRGLSPTNFDKHGNYNFGISEQLVFPEIDYDSVEQRRGFNITIVTTATNSREALFFLKELGFPFTKKE
uniref:50S ribosomal protein L5, chloroplastic n=1 Tax=Mallomonas splendens TaxID=52552 RepID=A0A3G2R0D0_9STRA|nr:ribosomal protein L5 [Mallomonas splendens]AYO28571.1 ribosomal protein L5 [Mallomonas splendens]